jgi:hypothetical protein
MSPEVDVLMLLKKDKGDSAMEKRLRESHEQGKGPKVHYDYSYEGDDNNFWQKVNLHPSSLSIA